MKNDFSQQEYEEFAGAEAVEPPAALRRQVMQRVSRALNPSFYEVLLKLAMVVLSVGVFNLFLCPQFGLGFSGHSQLYHFFMSFGEYGCRAFCGAFFLGSGLLVSTLVLNPEDLRVIQRYPALQVGTLAAGCLAGFTAAGGEVYLGAAIFWFVGSLVGGLISLELGAWYKLSVLYGVAK